MGRIIAMLLAGATLAVAGATQAVASPACRCDPAAAPARAPQAIAGRAHLVYRSEDRGSAFEGEVTFLQRNASIGVPRARDRADAIDADGAIDAAPPPPDRKGEATAVATPLAG